MQGLNLKSLIQPSETLPIELTETHTHSYFCLSNTTIINHFRTFLHTIDVVNSYWFLFEPTSNIIFVLINNHLPHQ